MHVSSEREYAKLMQRQSLAWRCHAADNAQARSTGRDAQCRRVLRCGVGACGLQFDVQGYHEGVGASYPMRYR